MKSIAEHMRDVMLEQRVYRLFYDDYELMDMVLERANYRPDLPAKERYARILWLLDINPMFARQKLLGRKWNGRNWQQWRFRTYTLAETHE